MNFTTLRGSLCPTFFWHQLACRTSLYQLQFPCIMAHQRWNACHPAPPRHSEEFRYWASTHLVVTIWCAKIRGKHLGGLQLVIRGTDFLTPCAIKWGTFRIHALLLRCSHCPLVTWFRVICRGRGPLAYLATFLSIALSCHWVLTISADRSACTSAC